MSDFRDVDDAYHLPELFTAERHASTDVIASLRWFDSTLGFEVAEWSGYTSGYLKAASHLLATARARTLDVEPLLYPIVYLCRQTIELKLKMTLREAYLRTGSTETFAMHHELDRHWTALEMVLVEIWPGRADYVLNHEIGERLATWTDLDRMSFGFRYPENKKGGPSHKLPLDRLNLTALFDGTRAIFRIPRRHRDGASSGRLRRCRRMRVSSQRTRQGHALSPNAPDPVNTRLPALCPLTICSGTSGLPRQSTSTRPTTTA